MTRKHAPLSWEQLQAAANVTRDAAEECLELGRCVFSSTEALRTALDCGEKIDDVTLVAWELHRAIRLVGDDLRDPLTDASSKPSPPVPHSDAQREQQQTWSTALKGIGFLLLEPVQKTVEGVWSWASWAATAPLRGIGLLSSSTEIPVSEPEDSPLIGAALWRSRVPSASIGKDVVFLPALHRICLHVVQNLDTRSPYNSIFTVDSWEDYLLSALGVRNGDVVTDFLVQHGVVLPFSDRTTGVLCMVYHLNDITRDVSARRVAHWKAMLEVVDDVMRQWENTLSEMDDLRQTARDEEGAGNAAEQLRERILRFKLIQVQMAKINGNLEAADVSSPSSAEMLADSSPASTGSSHVGAGARGALLAESAKCWDSMMENFPEVNELVTRTAT